MCSRTKTQPWRPGHTWLGSSTHRSPSVGCRSGTQSGSSGKASQRSPHSIVCSHLPGEGNREGQSWAISVSLPPPPRLSEWTADEPIPYRDTREPKANKQQTTTPAQKKPWEHSHVTTTKEVRMSETILWLLALGTFLIDRITRRYHYWHIEQGTEALDTGHPYSQRSILLQIQRFPC